jgi:hypothetical protein
MRRLAFAMAVVALGGAFLLIGRRPGPGTPSATRVPRPAASRAPSAGARPAAAAAIRPEARRFIAAFLSYEVGVGGPAITAVIQACASRHFAHQLLSEPPRPAGRPSHGAARITSLRIDPVPGHPVLALASGDARRPEGPEPFSFLFARRGGRWLAVAPGE